MLLTHHFPTLAFCTLLGLAGTGCAFVPVDVHPPDRPNASEKAFSRGRGRDVIVVGPFADGRSDDRCGTQKNGYGHETANVNCEVVPGRWLADALAMELERNGFRVLRGDAAKGPSSVVVQGTVTKMFLEPVDAVFTRTVEGDFAAKLVVTSPSGLHAERAFYVKGTDESIASTEGVFQTAAEDATRQIARRMALALVELLDRYPALGQPETTAGPS